MKSVPHILLLFLLIGCGTQKIADYKDENTPINEEITVDVGLESIISPYRDSMEIEMNEVIGKAEVGLTKGQPESPLGNFAAEAAYLAGVELGKQTRAFGPKIMSERAISLLNTGGLRAPINEGDITIGNMYELMPFDNTLVIVKLSGDQVRKMCRYLYENNGQPVYNATFKLTSEGEQMTIGGKPYNFDEDIAVITSDYLATGGDKMTFLEEAKVKYGRGKFLRDVFIDYVKEKKNLGRYESTGKFEIINE